jgi:predicted Zn-dependent peptidase
MRILALICALAAAATLPVQAAAPSFGAGVSKGTLPGGGSYIVSQQSALPVAAVELWYRAPSVGFARDPIPGLALLAAKAVAASVPITGTPLARLVAQMGGKLSIASYPDSVEISALVPANRAPDIVRVMTSVYFTPVLSAAGLRTARSDVAQEALIRSFDSDEVLRDALLQELFTTGPAHYPVYGKPEDVAKISLDTVTDFAVRAFRAKNALLIVDGAVDNTIVSHAVEGRPKAPKDDGEEAVANVVAAAPATAARDFSEPAFGYAFAGPRIADERAATAMDFISDFLFRPGTGVVAQRLAQAQVDVTGQFVTYRNPGVMLVQVSGSGDLKAARDAVDQALTQMRKPLDKEAFEAARAEFIYHLLSDLQTPLELADNFGWYSVEGDAAYAPGIAGGGGRYFAMAKGLTADYVASVAAKYLSTPGATVTLAPAPNPRPQATPEDSQ